MASTEVIVAGQRCVASRVSVASTEFGASSVVVCAGFGVDQGCAVIVIKHRAVHSRQGHFSPGPSSPG
jgi:hypothetical protein